MKKGLANNPQVSSLRKKDEKMVHIVLLSGGSGSRLWPLSNSSRSKQFLKVLRDGEGNHVSMVQRVFSQIRKVDADLDLTIATCASQEFSIRSQIGDEGTLVLEPERRDTAPAIMLACANLSLEQRVDDDETVVVMPIDSYADQAYYDEVTKLDEAVQSDFADLVLLGVEPTFPSEKYGYIVPSGQEGNPQHVARFAEKPDEATARDLIARGALWNCGVFAFRLGYLNSIARGYLRAKTFEEFRTRYAELPKNSFDYEVVEKAQSIGVIRYSGIWKDLGTWNTLTEEMSDVVSGRAVIDASTCSNVHVINETNLPMVVAGLSNAVVVATHDGILACGKESSSRIKQCVSEVAEGRPRYERCCWGEYRVLDSSVHPDGKMSLTGELVVTNGSQICCQRHSRRTKVWTIVCGVGEISLNGETMAVSAGTVVSIEAGTRHAIRALGSDLHIVEVQMGDDLENGDVESLGSCWK